MQLLVNQIGYEPKGNKTAVILSQALLTEHYAILKESKNHNAIMQLPIHATGQIDQWQVGFASTIDFSFFDQKGEFYIELGDFRSHSFTIEKQILFKRTFSDLLHYFKSQRAGGAFEKHDHSVALFESDKRVNVSGGWYDASGDVSKYLSHLSYTNYLNPQQIPMVTWHMLSALEQLDNLAPMMVSRLAEEACHGADFLSRMQDEAGFFYLTVFDKWSKDPAAREICAYKTQDGIKTSEYQAGFRQGGGVSIAALALAANLALSMSEFTATDYQNKAENGYWHLKENNLNYLDDRIENIIDFYCALLASVELYKLTKSEVYLEESRIWAGRLSEQQQSDENIQHFWAANGDGSRPYFHAAEAGLPVIALIQYLKIETAPELLQKYRRVLSQSIDFELHVTNEINNPFGYPRQYIKNIDASKRTSFFIAQRNESDYWWQGENARIASLSAMAYQASSLIENESKQIQLQDFAQQALNWILGLNPFDMCMLDGHGHNNPDYLPDLGFFNAKGGICNGITAGFENEHDIAFNPEAHKDDMLQSWRWVNNGYRMLLGFSTLLQCKKR